MLVNHPANRILRLVLEIVGLISLGQWGWDQGTEWTRYALALAIPLTALILWLVLNSPGDPGRSNANSTIAIPGLARLTLEWLLFMMAIATMIARGQYILAASIGFAVFMHYFWSIERVIWLIRGYSKS